MSDVEEELLQVCGEINSISLQAMVGSPSPKATRVLGHLHKKAVVILIDTGSTHNFVDMSVASKCNLTIRILTRSK